MTPPEKREAGPRNWDRPSETTFNRGSSLADRIDRFLHDLLLDVMLDGERRWWLKRAEDFETAKPRLADFHANSTPEQLREQWRRLDEIARACRARAELAPVDDIREDIAHVLAEFDGYGRLREAS